MKRILKIKKIVQVAHVTDTPGPVQTLAEFIEKDNRNDLKKYYFELNNRKFFGYLIDFWQAFWKIKKEKEIDLAIGMNCFDTLPLILLRKERIKKVVLFGTDFARKRFVNKLFNWVYLGIDKYCAKKADFVCCNTKRTIKQRLEEGVGEKKIIYSPNGVFLEKVKNNFGSIYDKKLVYIGHVSKEHGLERIMKVILDNNFCLDVIGGGPDLENLKRKYVNQKIKYLGRKSHNEVLEYLVNFRGFGVAPYTDKELDWTYYCDPVKVKEYLAFGIPVIISDVPEIAEQIKKERWGFVFNTEKDLDIILKKVNSLTKGDYQKMVQKIIRMKRNFDLNEIYGGMFRIIDARNFD